MKVSPARTAAFDILLRIEKEKAFSSVLLPIYEERLPAADRALCHELVLGVLRRQILLDRKIDSLANNKKLDVEVRLALRLGLYQLSFLSKVPDHSAINESVNLVSRARKASAKALVNAILRRSTREEVDLVFRDNLERISVEQSHPRWLIEKWSAAIGIAAAEELAAANNIPPARAFRIVGDGSGSTEDLITRSAPSKSVSGCYIIDVFNKQDRELVGEGTIYLQDEASQMTASAVKVPSGGAFLDVCAAPGGKVGLIAHSNPAARLVVAADVNRNRVRFLRENCRKQGVDALVVQHDAENGLPFALETFDVVLVDAPCSGTGTIRHNPEIRYSVEPADFGHLQAKQLRILTNASKVLKKGGLLVYSTCSIEPEENEMVCEMFLGENRDHRKIEPDVPREFIVSDGSARTWPHRDNMDGFFIASFVKMDCD